MEDSTINKFRSFSTCLNFGAITCLKQADIVIDQHIWTLRVGTNQKSMIHTQKQMRKECKHTTKENHWTTKYRKRKNYKKTTGKTCN